MNSSVSEPHALFPLTLFDRLFERATFLTGWLVEGTLDTNALETALGRVTQKWRMLSGRLYSDKNDRNETVWCIRVPLGTMPPDYQTYAFTTSVSKVPLANYISVPLPTMSNSLPYALFLHRSTPRQYTAWESTSHPLTCWHVTHFPADPSSGGKTHTCIGFARSHGVFDGTGAAAIMRALVAELHDQDWDIPPLPHEGYNINPVQEALDFEIQSQQGRNRDSQAYSGLTVLGVIGALKLLAWHIRERWWSGADRRILLMSKEAFSFLVGGAKSRLASEHNGAAEVTTGDILVAWILKAIYSNGTSPDTIVHCSNFGSFRQHLSPHSNSLLDYPHNAFVPLPYPSMSVREITSLSLDALSLLLAISRGSLSVSHVISGYKALQESVTAFPANRDADESLTISNVSASRILQSDWSVIGANRTLCGYRYQLTPAHLVLTNVVYISGRLHDGSVVLDITLSKARTKLMEDAIYAIESAKSLD